MKYQQISGQTPVTNYHIPPELDAILAVPKQEAVLTYLSQIPHTLFPEFIKDILVLVEHHSAVTITDGAGDEQQDILTITHDGKRCLIQCKHTSDYLSNYNGKDLDILHTACIRKNCQQGLFITNGEITTQAKRYITDNEYLRGWPKESTPIVIGYWNYNIIWEKIHTNNIILNKWFGGLGQVHGLRNFTFDVALHQLPFEPTKNEDILKKTIFSLTTSAIIKPRPDGAGYEGEIDTRFQFIIRPGIHLLNHIDIPYLPPEDNQFYSTKILDSISIEVIVRHDNSFNAELVRQEIILYLFENNLLPPPAGYWFHLLCGRITSFVFLHDIKEPRQIVLAQAKTFIKTATSPICSEVAYCTLSSEEYSYSTEEEDHGMFKHSGSGIYLLQYFKQRPYPSDGFNTHEIKEKQRQVLSEYTFKMIGQVHSHLSSTFITMLCPDWFAFQNEKTFIWCYPPGEDQNSIDIFEEKLQRKGFDIFTVAENEKSKIIEDTVMIIPDFMMHNKIEGLSFPIDLTGRLLWLAKSFDFGKTSSLKIIDELVGYKFAYEKANGYSHIITARKVSYTDLTHQLFEATRLRGSVMLDINIWNNPIWVVMRFRDPPTLSNNELAAATIKVFEKVFADIQQIFTKYALQ